jgi:hypothetical protein
MGHIRGLIMTSNSNDIKRIQDRPRCDQEAGGWRPHMVGLGGRFMSSPLEVTGVVPTNDPA